MRALLLTACVAVCAFAALAGPAHAAPDLGADDLEVIDDAALEDLRGGFSVGGMEIGFGAVVTSTLNGVPVMTTQLTVTDTGTVVEQTLNALGQQLSTLTPEQLTALGLGAFAGLDGVVISSESGVTTFVHNVTSGSLQNILVNTATGQDIEQHIDVTLTLPGFEYIQNQLMLERFGMQLGDDLRSMALGRTG